MNEEHPHIGSTFESWLEESDLAVEASAAALKAVIAYQLAGEMQKQNMSVAHLAELMKTSRAQVNRLLDPDNNSATIESLQRAARALGRELRLELR